MTHNGTRGYVGHSHDSRHTRLQSNPPHSTPHLPCYTAQKKTAALPALPDLPLSPAHLHPYDLQAGLLIQGTACRVQQHGQALACPGGQLKTVHHGAHTSATHLAAHTWACKAPHPWLLTPPRAVWVTEVCMCVRVCGGDMGRITIRWLRMPSLTVRRTSLTVRGTN